MKPFEALTQQGQLRRLRQVALAALAYYDLDVVSVRFYTQETNTMFEVRTNAGERLVLRIYSEGESTLRENQAEIFWLTRLVRDTDLRVTEPVARRDGTFITVVGAPGVPGTRRCVLFRWVPGRPLEAQLTPGAYAKLGRAMAMLHAHAETLNPLPPEIRPKRWDRVFYYPDEPVVYNTPAYSTLFPPERIALLDAVIDQSEAALGALQRDDRKRTLIHGDLHYWNVHSYRGELYLLDFEDVMLGYPVQDVAITLSYGRERDGYAAWRAAFEHGYTELRPWPVESERQLQTLMAARLVMFVNYVARIDPSPADYVEQRCAMLRRFLEGGAW